MKGTIKPTNEITALFSSAQRIHAGSVMALVQKSNSKHGLCGRVAFIAGKSLGNAPTRNRAKRLMRAAAHSKKAPWDNADVAFVAKKKIVTASLADILEDFDTIQQKTSKIVGGETS